MLAKLRHERGRRHAGLGVDLEEDQLACGLVPAEVRARDPAAAERAMRGKRVRLDRAADLVWNARRQDVLRAAGRVLGLVVVELEMVRGDDIYDLGHAVADDGAGELPPRDEL